MGWGRQSRFFMSVPRSSRMHPVTICGDARSGLKTIMAGEKGSIITELYAGSNGTDRFEISFQPWRSCKDERGNINLASGILDFDILRSENDGRVQVVVDKDLREAIEFMRAKQVMLGG